MIPYFDIPIIQIPGVSGAVGGGLHGFGILVALGFVLGGNVAMGRARRMGLDPDVINRLVSWLVVGTLVGGHIGFLLMYDLEGFLADPVQVLYVWQGLSSYGGFVVCVPLAIWYFHREKVDVWKYLDCLAHGMTVGWFMGRMGCFVAHDHPGTPGGDFPLAVYCRPVEGHTLHLPDFMVDAAHRGQIWGPCRDAVDVLTTHDMGLYEALFSLTMFGVFTLLDRGKKRVPGFYVLLLGACYAPVRFAMDFLRPELTDNRWLGLTPAQYWSMVFFAVALYFLSRRIRSGAEPVGP